MNPEFEAPYRARSHRARRQTPAKASLWKVLRRRRLGVRFRRDAPVFGLIADFYCPALMLVINVVETSGDQASRTTAHIQAQRHRLLQRWGFLVLHVSASFVLNNREDVVTRIETAISTREYALTVAATAHVH